MNKSLRLPSASGSVRGGCHLMLAPRGPGPSPPCRAVPSGPRPAVPGSLWARRGDPRLSLLPQDSRPSPILCPQSLPPTAEVRARPGPQEPRPPLQTCGSGTHGAPGAPSPPAVPSAGRRRGPCPPGGGLPGSAVRPGSGGGVPGAPPVAPYPLRHGLSPVEGSPQPWLTERWPRRCPASGTPAASLPLVTFSCCTFSAPPEGVLPVFARVSRGRCHRRARASHRARHSCYWTADPAAQGQSPGSASLHPRVGRRCPRSLWMGSVPAFPASGGLAASALLSRGPGSQEDHWWPPSAGLTFLTLRCGPRAQRRGGASGAPVPSRSNRAPLCRVGAVWTGPHCPSRRL